MVSADPERVFPGGTMGARAGGAPLRERGSRKPMQSYTDGAESAKFRRIQRYILEYRIPSPPCLLSDLAGTTHPPGPVEDKESAGYANVESSSSISASDLPVAAR